MISNLFNKILNNVWPMLVVFIVAITLLFMKVGKTHAIMDIPSMRDDQIPLYGVGKVPEPVQATFEIGKILLIVLMPVVLIIGIVTIIRCRTKKPKANTKPNTNVENNNENKQG